MSRSKETGFKYNDSYHEFFDGYSEKKNPETGRIERVYTADYFEHDMSNTHHAILKAGYCILFLIAAVCLLLPLWILNSITKSPAAAVLEFAAIIIMVPNAVFLILYIMARRRMTAGEFHQSAVRMRKFMSIGAAVYLILFLVYTVLLIISLVHGTFISGDIIITAGALAGAAAVAAISLIERKIRYRAIKNENSRPEGSVEIWR